jgi:hypothetical protein
MAPFTSRQTNYIRAIAGQQQHKSLIARQVETSLVPFSPPNLRNNTGADGAALYGLSWYLNNAPRCHYPGAPADPIDADMTAAHFGCLNLNRFNTYEGSTTTDTKGRLYLLRIPSVTTSAPATADPGHTHVVDESQYIESKFRAGVEGYLESTHMKLFCTLPVHSDTSDTGVLGSPHYEFRIIVFRNKLPGWNPDISEADRVIVREGVSLLNPNYDLFMGQTGRPRGFLGWRQSKNFDLGAELEKYQGMLWDGNSTAASAGEGDVMPDSEQLFTTKDYMTMPLNRNDYVVHTDQRFFLGKEQGKSHMEKEFHFDWNDFIDTTSADLTASPTLDKKNYDWQFLILGTSNSQEPADLKVELRATTSMKSGM